MNATGDRANFFGFRCELATVGGSWELEGEVDCDDSRQTFECQMVFCIFQCGVAGLKNLDHAL